MRVLFLHTNSPDYLAESIFHGLRSLLGSNCLDVPRYDSMYKPLDVIVKSKLRGHGFTLYGLLEDIPELIGHRYFWEKDVEDFNFIIIADINKQWHQLRNLTSMVLADKIIVLDGSDSAAIFPFNSFGDRIRKDLLSIFTLFDKLHYFKRELILEQGLWDGADRYIPKWVIKRIFNSRHFHPISFSIPEEKIFNEDKFERQKLFPKHIVDSEIAERLKESFYSNTGSDKHFFTDESDYYKDLQSSKFGIVTKRAGWDSLRIYELAANGCVLCFKDFYGKPVTCPPHGLSIINSIFYINYGDLMKQISSISVEKYSELRKETYRWINANSTRDRAKYLLNVCQR